MKKYFVAVGMLLAIAFALTSCTPEQIALNLLAGEWGVTSVSVDGVEQDPATYKGVTYTFDDCLESDPECYGRIEDPVSGNDINFTYTVGEDFDDFSLRYEGGINEDWVYDVDEHSFSKIVFTVTDQDGVQTTTTLEKNN